MARFVQFATALFFALIAFAAVARAEKYYDEDGKELVFFDSEVGDDEFEDDETEKRSFNLRGKSAFGTGVQRRINVHHFTHGPDHREELMEDNVKITWYASEDLKRPACGNDSWDPTNRHHIGAVLKTWKEGPQCGDFVRLCNEKVKRCVKVRVVDYCEGCSKSHIDLTKSAFKRLCTTGTLDEGITTGLKMFTSRYPNPWDFSLFGPFKLK